MKRTSLWRRVRYIDLLKKFMLACVIVDICEKAMESSFSQ